MGEIVLFPGKTLAALPPSQVLERALATPTPFKSVVVLGFLEDGDLYTASSTSDGGEVFWLIERARHAINRMADDMEV